MRLFVAIEFDKGTKLRIEKIQNDLKRLCKRGKWVNVENIHLTLKFLGEVYSDRIKEIGSAMEEVTSEFNKFNLKISSLGKFGRDEVRVLWLGLNGDIKKLRVLNKNIEEKLCEIGFEKERRKFSPHITLAREVEFKDNFENIKSVMNNHEFEEFKVNKFVLMSSEFIDGRRVYTVIGKYDLR